MRVHPRALAIAIAVVLPVLGEAQHSHGGGGMDVPPRRARPEHASPPDTARGLLPLGSPRQVEVLVLSYGFSPTSISAQQGEEIVLLVRRVDESPCAKGIVIPAKQVAVDLPLNEEVPVALKLDRAETIDVQCANEDVKASIVVEPR
jgi:hypothetical protein